MAAPAIRSAIGTSGSPATATPVVSLPATVKAGDTLFVAIRCAVGGAVGWPGAAGVWNEMHDASDDIDDDENAFAWKLADGSEGGTTITLSSALGKFAAAAWAVSGAISPKKMAPELSTVAIGSASNPDPTAVTPGGGAADYLVLALAFAGGEPVFSAYPTSYTLGQVNADSLVAGATTTNARIAGAARQLAAATTENPGNFTYTGTVAGWTAFAVAFYPEHQASDPVNVEIADAAFVFVPGATTPVGVESVRAGLSEAPPVPRVGVSAFD